MAIFIMAIFMPTWYPAGHEDLSASFMARRAKLMFRRIVSCPIIFSITISVE